MMVAKEHAAAEAREAPQEITIRAYRSGTEDARSFSALNKTWILEHFTLEARDLESLDDPDTSVIGRGGEILMACAGGEAVGCVALLPLSHRVYELSKMTVSSAHRGRGIGRRLLQEAIRMAKDRGAESLFLGSNRKLADAVHLYESVGFLHVAPERIPPLPYARADVFMELVLK